MSDQGCQPGGGGGPPGPPGPQGPPGGGPGWPQPGCGPGGPPRQSWQLFQSQLLPQPGSHHSPGHHCGKGPGWACASVATPKPAKPSPPIARAVAAKRGRVFTKALLPISVLWLNKCRQCLALRDSCQSAAPPRLRFGRVPLPHFWHVEHQKTFRPSSTVVRIGSPETRQGSPARR
ncbi:hypothetical protein BST30_18640 [Mycobacterium mantenii]|uniref:Uncharacterized protein n=1 Tax=Mycobacterium mantenii TaxID=560555 RepID=A0A1X0FMD1_MYCNT|nr:hypothetical protein BST30_18640 [Mycobacterium mantenii]